MKSLQRIAAANPIIIASLQAAPVPARFRHFPGWITTILAIHTSAKIARVRVSRSDATNLTGSNDIGAFFPAFPVAPNKVGPPDLDVVEYLPPSAKQVFLALASDGPLTQKDLIIKTDLPPRTVRYALSRLKGEDMLEERFCFRDARQSLYSLNGMEAR